VVGHTGIEVHVPAIPLHVPEQARQLLNSLMVNTLRLALQDAAGKISGEAPVDTGGLAQSFGADPATDTGGIELLGIDVDDITGRVFSSLPYAIVMDQGRRPGQPISRAGIDAIGLWARRKLGLSPEQAESAKWAIASAIIERGIPATRFFAKGTTKAIPTIEGLFKALGDAIGQQLTGGGRA
jgi:hypothetical protein